MNLIAIAFLTVNAVLLLLLPRRWAPLPLLMGACYMTVGQVIEIGPFHFNVIRLLVAVGVVRILVRHERLTGGMNLLDRLMVAWAVWMLISSYFHLGFSESLVFRLGLVYNACGLYFLIRIFCRSLDELAGLYGVIAILLLPVAVEMLNEKLTGYNFFSVFGGVSDMPAIRNGKIRAQGPFAHAILAGTIGAVCLPLVIALWRIRKREAMIGIGACSAIIIASASSGPIMSAMAAMAALFMWRYRQHTRIILWLAVLGYIGLELVMNDPAYYILARIDLTGGSTGWHRARLIESSIEHLSEWWLAGTDYTRHWMPSGVTWSMEHTDITNHYLKMGVIGGLPLMFLFMAILATALIFVSRMVRRTADLPVQTRFMIWALGASLFAHAATFVSVSYFDQSFVFIYLTLAAIGSCWSAVRATSALPAALNTANNGPHVPAGRTRHTRPA